MVDEAGELRTTKAKTDLFRQLHADPKILILVNVWDVASAKTVAALPGCLAVATASAAIAAAHGYPDGERIPADMMLAAVGRIAAAIDLPVTADLESGYGDVDRTIRRAIQLGIAGANIEDAMRPLRASVSLMEQAVRAGEAEGVKLVLNARTDCYLRARGEPPDALFQETVERGEAFLDVGADCVFVPGCTEPGAIARLAERFGRGRLSLLALPDLPPPGHLAELGVARVSYGPFPHHHALRALADLATEHFDSSRA